MWNNEVRQRTTCRLFVNWWFGATEKTVDPVPREIEGAPRATKCCTSEGHVRSRGYGATAARLTPDQKVGSSNLSALIIACWWADSYSEGFVGVEIFQWQRNALSSSQFGPVVEQPSCSHNVFAQGGL